MARHQQFGGGGGINANMMKQVQKMQQDMTRTQTELEERVYSTQSGGGAVSVSLTGKHELQSLALKPEVVDSEDIEMLQDLIISAVNAAIAEADADKEREMSKFGMNLPF
ncbi:nucleoid-associated protein [Clostridia bacterium]|nr:nucleoid-associated protein [Clostridia bacterium]